jgi:hypothetical protein
MKKPIYLLACAIVIAMNADGQQVGTDQKLGSGIKNYSTYQFSDELDKIPQDAVFIGPNNVVVFNNESTRSNIKEAIRYELSAKGYKMVEKSPDFVVTFIVLEKPAELTTYNGYRLIHNGMDTVRTKENVEEVEVKPGTLLVSFVDFQTGKEVWQGYASGILKSDMVNDRSKIRNAVKSIFDEYQYGPLARR